MNATDEPPVDTSLAPYMEERALAIARPVPEPARCSGGLASHARTHPAFHLVSARLLRASHTPDIAPAARLAQALEDAGRRCPRKRATRAVLAKMRETSRGLPPDGSAFFEVDL